MKETFHIFSGDPTSDPVWMEAVEGLFNARTRMEEIAARKPGRYFLFLLSTRSVLAQTDTLVQPLPMRRR